MATRQIPATEPFKLGRAVKKLFLSAFVIFTFLVYAVHERLSGPGQTAGNTLPAEAAPTASAQVVPAVQVSPTASQPQASRALTSQPTISDNPGPTTVPTAQPTEVILPSPSATAAGQYKDGQFTGPQVDAFYGWVQVQAVVQHGQIADVKFLQYPSDRRTSQRINNIAMPWLTQEAVQAQSANVDIISGATLTSQAFAQSLQAALAGAKP